VTQTGDTAMSNALMISPREENCRLRARNLAAKIGFLTVRDIWHGGQPEPASVWEQLPRIYPRMGSRIYPDDEEMPRLILIENGPATLYLRRPIREFVRRVEPGTILGEMPLVGLSMLGTEAEAGRDCQVILLDEAAVEQFILRSADTASRLLRLISPRLV